MWCVRRTAGRKARSSSQLELELEPPGLLWHRTLPASLGGDELRRAGESFLMEDKVCAGTSWGPFSMGLCPRCTCILMRSGVTLGQRWRRRAPAHRLRMLWPPPPGWSSPPAPVSLIPQEAWGLASGHPLPGSLLLDTFVALLPTTALVSAFKGFS